MEINKQRFNTTREWILNEAEKKVLGKEYGAPNTFFDSFAALFNWRFGLDLTAAQACEILLLMKIARLKSDPSNADTHIDVAGYASCLAEVKGIKEK